MPNSAMSVGTVAVKAFESNSSGLGGDGTAPKLRVDPISHSVNSAKIYPSLKPSHTHL